MGMVSRIADWLLKSPILWGGLAAGMWGSAAFVVLTWLFALRLPALPTNLKVSLAAVTATD